MSTASARLRACAATHPEDGKAARPWRRGICVIAALCALLLLPPTHERARAQDWPARPVRIIVPFGAGSTPDFVARLIAEALHQRLQQPFVVENRPGASGNTGTNAVAKADPDGYTFGISIGGPLAINALLFNALPYDPVKDLAPVTQLVTQPSILTVNVSLGVNSVGELVDALRREPLKHNFASIGVGSLSHLTMEAIAQQSGAAMVHVAYPSSPAAVTALIRNDAQLACLPGISVLSQAQSGALRLLAVSTSRRSALVPDLPTLREAGLEVEADAWNGLIAPAGTPEFILRKIREEVAYVVNSPAMREKLASQLMEPVGNTADEFRAKIEAERVRWGPVIRAGKIRAP